MGRFWNLLCIDAPPGGRALRCALEVARALEAPLTVARIAGHAWSPIEPPKQGRDAHPPSRRAATSTTVPWSVPLDERLAAGAAARGVPVRVRLLESDGVEAVLREIARGGYDLVFEEPEVDPGPFPLRRSARAVRSLIHRSPSPMWLLGPEHAHPPRSVLAAVELAADAPPGPDRAVLRTAAALAAGAGAELHVVHAWSILGESVLACPLRGLDPERLRRLHDDVRSERQRRLERRVAEETGGLEVQLFLPKGDPRTAVPVVARRTDADVVVLGAPARTGIGSLLFPGLAAHLLGRIPASVLLVPRAPRRRGGLAERTSRPRLGVAGAVAGLT